VNRTPSHIHPGAELHASWSFIVDGDLDYGAHEEHRWGVRIGDDSWWCAGCLAWPAIGGWPSMSLAPNGLRLVLRYLRADDRVARRFDCPILDEEDPEE